MMSFYGWAIVCVVVGAYPLVTVVTDRLFGRE